MLTVFRRERLSNKENEEETSTNLLNKLIAKTVEIALKEGVIEVKNKVIQDSTHTNAMYQHISPREELIKQAKELRKSIYKIDENMHEKCLKKGKYRTFRGANQRIDVRNKIARELCVNLLIHREFLNPYPAKLIIEKDVIRTENANRAKMIGKLDINSYEPYPKNPKIAKVFKEIGLADELGSGVKNMVKYTKIYSGGVPELKEDDVFKAVIPLEEDSKAQDKAQDKDINVKILNFCKEERNIFEVMEHMGYKNRTRFRRDYIKPLLEKGMLQMTIPDKPSSRNQKYVTKEK